MSFSFKCLSHYSVGTAFNHIKPLAKAAKTAGWPAVVLCDNHTLSGVAELFEQCEKQKITPVIGCNYRLPNGKFITLLALNKLGYENLVKILGKSRPSAVGSHIDIKDIMGHQEGTLLVLGDINSIVEDGPPSEDLKALIESYKSNAVGLLTAYGIPDEDIRNEMVKRLALPRNCHTIPCYYPLESNLIHQQIVNAASATQTLAEYQADPKHYLGLLHFCTDKCWVRPSANYKKQPDWLLPMIEPYSIKHKPMVPKWSDKAMQEIKDLCRTGWMTRGLPNKFKANPELKTIYGDRIKMELEVFEKSGLADYMLIIRDVIQYCHKNHSLVGLRGSASGCLISYLIGISDIDPVIPDPTLPYHQGRSLVFERFFNDARSDSFPDIDIDLCPSFRKQVKEYLTEKYGIDNVAQYIVTYNRYDGRGVFQEVCRVLGTVHPDQVKEITMEIMAKDKIQSDLEDLRDEKPDYTTLEYNIDHYPKVREYAQQFPYEFEIAIGLSDTIASTGKHAAGMVISPVRIRDTFPIILGDRGEVILGLEMKHAEGVGAVKYDLLCVNAYEKINQILLMINNNLLEPTNVEEFEEDAAGSEN
jgi:DNA polymerase III subunit alpha